MKTILRSNILYLLFISFLTIVNIFIYIKFDGKIDEIKKNILEFEIEETKRYGKNISNMILSYKNGKDLHSLLKEDEDLRLEIEKRLSLFITSKYKNIFVIRKDKEGKFRYLLDAEIKLENKGDFDQRFHPLSHLWDDSFILSQSQHIVQDKINELWITLLYPINANFETEAVIAFDFSNKDNEEVMRTLAPLKEIFFYLSILMVLMLIVSFSLLYSQYVSKKKSNIDPLTSIYNRYYLDQISEQIDLDNYEICMIDIDYFKKINDTYGHIAGDEVLKNFSKRIKNHIKDTDIFIRYGGEEFLLLLNKKNDTEVCNVPERLRELIETGPIGINDEIIYVTASFGVDNKPHLASSLKNAIKIADEQLYKAKHSGRNKVIHSHFCS